MADDNGEPRDLSKRKGHTLNLKDQVSLAGWPTPMAEDTGQSPETFHARRTQKKPTLGIAAQLAGWPTPATPSGGRSTSTETMDATGRTVDGRKHTASLEHAVKFAGWATPINRDWKDTGDVSNLLMNYLGRQALGLLPSGSPASTEKRGALNPAFSLWLQGYPPRWMASAPSAVSVRSEARATASSRKPPQPLSAPVEASP